MPENSVHSRLHSIAAFLSSAKVQGIFHLCGLVVFLALVAPSVLWWSTSVPYLVYLSVYAVVVAHWAGAVAALSALRTEQANGTDHNDSQRSHDAPGSTCSHCGRSDDDESRNSDAIREKRLQRLSRYKRDDDPGIVSPIERMRPTDDGDLDPLR
jgi:hypothetical protein